MRFWKTALLASMIGAISLMAACLTEDSFTDQYQIETCDLAIECFDDVTLEFLEWETAQDCLDAGDEAEGDDDDAEECDFDAAMAQDCLDEVAAISCDDYVEGVSMDSCADVCQ